MHNAGGGDNHARSLHWRVEHTGPARCNEAAPVPSSSLLAYTAAAAALALVSGCGRACATAAAAYAGVSRRPAIQLNSGPRPTWPATASSTAAHPAMPAAGMSGPLGAKAHVPTSTAAKP